MHVISLGFYCTFVWSVSFLNISVCVAFAVFLNLLLFHILNTLILHHYFLINNWNCDPFSSVISYTWNGRDAKGHSFQWGAHSRCSQWMVPFVCSTGHPVWISYFFLRQKKSLSGCFCEDELSTSSSSTEKSEGDCKEGWEISVLSVVIQH